MQIPLKYWQAWAPGISTISDWKLFYKNQIKLDDSQKPDVSFLPPMFRRKLSSLSRMIFSTINVLETQSGKLNCPVILATRHGELDLSTDLINAELSETPFSPAKFSMSVHNSPVGFLSIQSGNKNPSTAISAGIRTLEMALYESLAMLQVNKQVLLIYADLPLSSVYDQYSDEESIPICFTALLEKGFSDKDIHFTGSQLQPLQLIEQLCNTTPQKVS